ncbi:LysO family transporter [uncultured Proteiniphilum sp.]|uniref:LysO family transporter n=1 Tax=uncultured Proteiniphilum sp. TaxID=497637 RepID=UPI002602529E|nr:LysO family transporter [uncultured Proteiniphilum sp.]
MIPIILCIATGILAGFLVRNTGFVKYTGTLLTVVITLLFFFLGVSVGNNEQVVRNFASIGLDAFILTVGGTLGSLFCIKWIDDKFF